MYFNFVATVIILSDFGAQENKICHYFHISLIYLHEVMGLDPMTLVFLMLSLSQFFTLLFHPQQVL